METELMVVSDDGRTTRTTTTNRAVPPARASRRFNFFHLASLCMAMAVLALLIAAAVFISTPGDRKPARKTEKVDPQGFAVKGIFNTNYGLDNGTTPVTFESLNEMKQQLNSLLPGNTVQLTDAFFLNDPSSQDYQQTFCDHLLVGLVLQLNLIVGNAQSCAGKEADVCKKNLVEQIKGAFDRLQTIRMRVRLGGNRVETIEMKLCDLLDAAEASASRPSVILKKSRCDRFFSRLRLVDMSGAQGSRLYDDSAQPYTTVILEEESSYQMRLHFECDEQTCEMPQETNVWIDFNDNGLDDGEGRMLRRNRVNRKRVGDTYELEVHIPAIDGSRVRRGKHRLHVIAAPGRRDQRECAGQDEPQTREYDVQIIAKALVPAARPAPLTLPNPLCSQPFGRVVLVLMAGERGTEIRDDQRSSSTTLNHDASSRHHLSVTLYEHTIYLLRVQLDCNGQLQSDLFENGCNLAQDVHLWLDGKENRDPYRWPVSSYMVQGIYDLPLYVPPIDQRGWNERQHRLRIVVTPNDHHRSICGDHDRNETREYSVKSIPRHGYVATGDVPTPRLPLRNIVCSSYVGKIVMVIMAGEHRTQIRDDRSQGEQSIALFEDTVYQLRIQLDCNRAWTRDALEYSCSLVYDVNIWIDLNDDGVFDQSENAAPYRWPLQSYTPQGVYDLQLSVPPLDSSRVSRGPHRMQLAVTMNDDYRRQCGDDEQRETREYRVSIVSRTSQPVDTRVPSLQLTDRVCTQKNGKIALVLMAGEEGTVIRDNLQLGRLLTNEQNQHHLAVTLHDNTIYRIRIQLDCFPHGRGGFPDADCNVAQDVNVLIDLDDDNRLGEEESRIPQRWPLLSSISLGIYDLDVSVPSIDQQRTRRGPHRMQVIVTPSDEYRRICGPSNYREVREYTVNIVPRTTYGETKQSAVCSPRHLVCAAGSFGFGQIELIGEDQSEIHDERRTCDPTNNYLDQTDQSVLLFANRIYTLHVELQCNQAGSDCFQSQHIAVWIDWNHDGQFDETNERIFLLNQDESNEPMQQINVRIVVPATNARQESHRMRVLIAQYPTDPSPCDAHGHGEARDYNIRILP